MFIKRRKAPQQIPETELDLAYRLLLGRLPESPAIVEQWRANGASLESLALEILRSEEFSLRWKSIAEAPEISAPPPEELALLKRFAHAVEGDPAHITNFLGVRTRTAFLPGLAASGGLVEGLPIPCNFHGDRDEWLGTLRSVAEARRRFVAVELGAGWGPWLVSSAVAARRIGIEDIRLVAVEADAGKIEFLKTHLRDNGLDPANHAIFEAVVAAADGRARFPIASDPSHDWGAAALESEEPSAEETGKKKAEKTDRRGLKIEKIVEVEALSLETLLAPYRKVDLVHCDIQGEEAKVLRAGFAALDQRVRRIVIGTHGRAIEEEPFDLFAAAGWILESEKPCLQGQHGRRVFLTQDGCQVWSNPRRRR